MFGRRRRRGEQQPAASESGLSLSTLPSETALRQAAAGGSPEDMNRLGVWLKVDGRQDEAAEWFRKAAEAGNADAMANLALDLMGRGRNSEAAGWFRRAGGPLGEAMGQELSGMPDDPRPR